MIRQPRDDKGVQVGERRFNVLCSLQNPGGGWGGPGRESGRGSVPFITLSKGPFGVCLLSAYF